MIKQKLKLWISAVALALLPMLVPLSAQAAGASIYLSANKSTVTNGGTLIVAVYMNGGGASVNGVEADLSYPASQLQYVGLSYTGSAFEITAPSTGGSGAVNIARGTTGSVSGQGLVATITFKALVSSGSASIGLLGSSALASDGTAVPAGTSGTRVTFGVATTTPAATSSATQSTAQAAPAAAPPKDTTPPVISTLATTGLTPFTATITWTTNEPSTSVVNYGLDASYGISYSSASLTTSHSLALNSSFLTPLAVLHYQVKSVDAAGNVATGSDQHLQLPGVPVTIIVRSANGKPQVGATVSLDNQTATTDSKGMATIPSSLGNKQVTTSYNGVTVQRNITVGKTTKPLPPYQLDLSKKPLNHWMLTSTGLLVVILVLLGIDAVLFGSHFFMRLSGLHKLLPKTVAASAGPTPPVAHQPVFTKAAVPLVTTPVVEEPQPPTPAPSTVPVDPSVIAEEDVPLDVSKSVAELMGEAPLAPSAPLLTNKVTKIAVKHHKTKS